MPDYNDWDAQAKRATGGLTSRQVAEAAAKKAAPTGNGQGGRVYAAQPSVAGGWNAAGTKWTAPSGPQKTSMADQAIANFSRTTNGGRVYKTVPTRTNSQPMPSSSGVIPLSKSTKNKHLPGSTSERPDRSGYAYPQKNGVPQRPKGGTPTSKKVPQGTVIGPGGGQGIPQRYPNRPNTQINDPGPVYPPSVPGSSPNNPVMPGGQPTGKTMIITDWNGRPHEVPIYLFYDKNGNPYESQAIFY